jgi:hypothetical protein
MDPQIQRLLNVLQSTSTKQVTRCINGDYWTVVNTSTGFKITKNGVLVQLNQ